MPLKTPLKTLAFYPEAAQNRAMQSKRRTLSLGLVSALSLGATVAALGQPVITSFSANGVLACSNLAPGSVAVVEWASSVAGPWTNNWAGLEAVTADANGTIQVSMPMFYRVRGTTNNFVPSGMALIPAGPFVMGDTFGEGYSGELPLHTNQISAFYLDKFEVTKALWDGVYNWAITHGYSFDYGTAQGKATNHPAHTVTWYDAVKWCNARSEQEGRTPAYYINVAQTTVYRTGQTSVQNDWVKWSSGYQLPTEAEWEKAARGGVSGQRFPWGNTISWGQANYYAHPLSAGGYAYDLNATSGWNPAWTGGGYPYTTTVGTFAANGYGLYDMAGNVWEWCWDWYDGTYYTSSPGTDPRGPVSGSFRVNRGGGWNYFASLCRAANRYYDDPVNGYNGIGFRSALPAGQ